ncbi:hypothetical protein [Nocardiopsis sp. NRRL B-16309]|uniref:hypothetical protein n=1 Tax=Nocardiopsis sp. NRRL B-16309 TaxID=1519494 RepID=UPI0006AD98B5|nr:hypothetical protein [Nocardiopsis sp. NRRL B-16309]KOX10106.1 hypothetical protein ADL05_25825 [Nocardiopsis sp. NRRL B-16309]
MIETANISVSVVCLIVGLICWFSKAWPKAQLVLFILAGAGMGAGFIGGSILDGIASIMSAVDGGMADAFGAPVPGLLAVTVTLFIVLGWMGKLGWMKKGSRIVTALSAFGAPLIWHMTGGIFGGLAMVAGSIGGVLGSVIFLPITGF